jgi:hypothetical protein
LHPVNHLRVKQERFSPRENRQNIIEHESCQKYRLNESVEITIGWAFRIKITLGMAENR